MIYLRRKVPFSLCNGFQRRRRYDANRTEAGSLNSAECEKSHPLPTDSWRRRRGLMLSVASSLRPTRELTIVDAIGALNADDAEDY